MFTREPSNLDELARLLDQAKDASEVFGDQRERRYRRFARLCHPDLFAEGPEQEMAKRVFLLLAQWFETASATITPRVIKSPSRHYTLVRQLAAGDLTDVYLAVSGGASHVLKITRPSGGNSLLIKEGRHLKSLCGRSGDRRYREYLPHFVETFALLNADGNRQVTVFTHREGFYTLEEIRRKHLDGLDARHLAWIFKRLLAVTGFAHTCGLVHGAVLPPHVMLHAENHGLQLLGWIHAVPIGDQLKLVPTKYHAWYPREVLNKLGTGPSTDLFLAAKCLIYLAGGDPVAERWPNSVLPEMKRFLNTCLFQAPRMRPQDAWNLHEEFDELLQCLFGPSKYHLLTMS